MSRRANDLASALYKQSLRYQVDLLDPKHTAGIESLLSKVYGKPVELNLTKLQKPHLDADILASVVRQKLSDRRVNTNRAIRDSAFKAQLPNEHMVTALKQAKWQSPTSILEPVLRRSSGFAKHRTPTSTIVSKLNLSQVSAVRVEAAGRLTRRMTANRSARKFARRGANAKGGAYMVRGFRKASEKFSLKHGKRRIGAFGVRAQIFHT